MPSATGIGQFILQGVNFQYPDEACVKKNAFASAVPRSVRFYSSLTPHGQISNISIAPELMDIVRDLKTALLQTGEMFLVA